MGPPHQTRQRDAAGFTRSASRRTAGAVAALTVKDDSRPRENKLMTVETLDPATLEKIWAPAGREIQKNLTIEGVTIEVLGLEHQLIRRQVDQSSYLKIHKSIQPSVEEALLITRLG